ncbi:2'-5'-oligoadenylate synthase 1-like [Amphiura filiformis]|uniref:2'-5'-oligoadenylate synthase 1-like n=1 Tax=Amphiura filiformis TaxID=82378 RepID=UPI003B20EC5A
MFSTSTKIAFIFIFLFLLFSGVQDVFICSFLALVFTCIFKVLWKILWAAYTLIFANKDGETHETRRSSPWSFAEEHGETQETWRTSQWSFSDKHGETQETWRGSPWSLTSTADFNSWYEREIVGSNFGYGIQDFREECGRAVDKVVRILHQRMHLNVKEVIKGGSVGKGTMLKRKSDIDCVVMINSPDLPYLQNVSDMSVYVQRDLAKANRNIEQAIKDHATVVSTKVNKFMVTATLNESGVYAEVDIIPTADNLAAEGKPQIYESMLCRSSYEREFYSVSLVKLQRDFIKTKPGVVKELTRLVKYWNKQTVGSVLKGTWPLPSSYPMELITILAWERAGSPIAFDRLQGFKAVLSIIATEKSTLNRHWTCNYDESMVQRALRVMDSGSKQSPFILDPANPTNNVCARFHSTWNDVVGVARQTLRSNLLSQVRVNARWN